MIKKYVDIVNISNKPVRITHFLLPNGGITLDAGSTTSIPSIVYNAVMRKYKDLIIRADADTLEMIKCKEKTNSTSQQQNATADAKNDEKGNRRAK